MEEIKQAMIKNMLNRTSIGTQLVMLVIVCVLMFVVLIVASYGELNGIIEEHQAQYTTELLLQINENLRTGNNHITDFILSIAYSPTAQQLLRTTDAISRYDLQQQLDTVITYNLFMLPEMLDFALISSDGLQYGYKYGRNLQQAMTALESFEENPFFSGIIQAHGVNGPVNSILVGLPVHSMEYGEHYGKRIGYAAAFINAQRWALPNQTQAEAAQTLYLLDREGRILSSSGIDYTHQISALGTPFDESMREGSTGQTYAIETMKGTLVSLTPNETLLFNPNGAIMRILLLSCALLMAVVLLSIFVIGNIINPLKKLMRFMELMPADGLQLRISLEGSTEMIATAQRFNTMLSEIDTLNSSLRDATAEIYRAEMEKNRAELMFLRSQINPHFLYNTLEMLNGMAAEAGTPHIGEIATSLARVFRYSISGREMVSLQDEMRVVASYLKIQQYRFESRLTTDIQVSGEAAQCQILRMLLQPLVENALIHGIEPMTREGRLCIAAYVEKDLLHIRIEDNGKGVEPQVLEKLRRTIRQQEQRSVLTEDGSVGIRNVSSRLYAHFKSDAAFNFNSKPDGGTVITLTLPAIRI